MLTSDTVADGVEQAARYFRLTGAPFELDIRSEENPVRVVDLITGPAPPCTVEYSAILCLQLFRSETDGRMRFAYVSLTYEPDDISDLGELFGCEVRARASWSGWAIPRDVWDLPLRRRDPVLRALLARQADAMATRAPIVKSLASDVRRVLASRLARGEADIGLVARDLAMSSRTLQRRLAAEGLSYHELLDRVRRETAETCLGDASLAIAEVAYLIGYSEPAAFHRAFRRWTGVTPQAFRQRSRGMPQGGAAQIG